MDDDAKQEYQKILEPLSPASRTNAGEDITIHLQHDSPTEYANLISFLLNTNHDKGVDSLVWAFLRGAEEEEAYNIFDGRKFKSSKGRGLAAYLIKFFKLLKASTNESGKLNTYVEIDGKRIDDMSPGMKAQALLKLFLNDGVKSGDWMYIILDQPEDNLDVATIKEFLIDRLKDLKLNVQFFVVSHSAPIIVNGDARAVVVCSNQNDTISYSQGALNDETIKQSIADVLDGGERYLKMRLNKYNFQLGDSDDKKQ